MMEFTAEMIAGFLGGEIVGDKAASVHTVSSIEEGKAGSLAYLTNPKYEPFLYTTQASIVLVNSDFTPSQPVAATLVKVPDAGACVLKLLEMYNAAKPRRKGISPRASIEEGATVGEECYIGDFTVVEQGVRIGRGCQIYPQVYLGRGVTVGEGTILYPGVKIYEGCSVGSRCILHIICTGSYNTAHINHVRIAFRFVVAAKVICLLDCPDHFRPDSLIRAFLIHTHGEAVEVLKERVNFLKVNHRKCRQIIIVLCPACFKKAVAYYLSKCQCICTRI